MRIGYYFAALGMATFLLACSRTEEDPYKGWVEHTPVPSDPAISQPTVTYAASPELAMANYYEFIPKNDCNLADVRHAFVLDKKEFLLGKPIKVGYRVWIEGPGTWHEPTGSAGIFRFLARHEDGTWCTTRNVMRSRGMICRHSVTTENPYNTTDRVQGDSIIEKPGRYDLFCFHVRWEMSHPKDGMGLSPLMKRMPEEVHAFKAEFYRKYLNDKEPFDTVKTDKASLDICKTEEDFEQYTQMREKIFTIEYADVFAHFTIVIRDKTAESVE